MRRLLVFLKYPTPGQVKTRLAASLGAEAAAAVARVCAELTLERLSVLRPDTALYVAPSDAVARTHEWLGNSWPAYPQRGRTLGERLATAMQATLADGFSPVVVIGSDSPWLSLVEIEDAFTALQDADVVLGPTEDGGYYLIGLSRPQPALFEEIVWSGPEVFQDTLARARAQGLRVRTLRQGYDLDRLEDVRRFLAESTRDAHPGTRLRALHELLQAPVRHGVRSA